ncbi:4-hydroxy-3-methylbut-2-enyl diphosphate reductase [Alkaliphilus sp. B6464]|uniref:4-hydroxy-3-methylbut-2-enyl diphosphate reductase n=1 Tax=Alkaliphilus sp. B6464 TaxID=2731219 RepID=UPI001BABC3D5|nr:4-hydroxy-3-methylbut-2-enyl diphosphate reductase [Alkaliphilus sp. B6464]QUH19063.1 4-hydroxy-3-methylbut-2-enyl diphosphate reductase [Alkaliphilus sp. B6464]
MKVILAEHLGFCFGVAKAVNAAFEKANNNTNNENLYALGPLIHNTAVVYALEEKGVKTIEGLEEVESGTVLIRSHGVSKEIYSILEQKKINVLDNTCPFVKKIQQIVSDYEQQGYAVAIIGNKKHPEVIGVNGWANYKSFIIQELEDAQLMPMVDKLCIVVQTTMEREKYNILKEELYNKAKVVEVFDTICNATKDRQESARELAQKVDAILVIGGYHSSNTQKLVEVCKSQQPSATYHIETARDIPMDQIAKHEVIGITAGASTPQWIIDEVIQALDHI